MPTKSDVTCWRCGQVKPGTDKNFLKPRKGRKCDLTRRLCRVCHRCYTRKNGQKRFTDLRTYLTAMVATARVRARHEGVTFEIDVSFVEELLKRQGSICAISGEPMTTLPPAADEHACPTNISLDRITPGSDYTAESVHLVCTIVNIMRNELSVNDLIRWCNTIVTNSQKAS